MQNNNSVWGVLGWSNFEFPNRALVVGKGLAPQRNHAMVRIMNLNFDDGEVMGLDNDGYVVCWDKQAQEPYNTNVTVAEFGLMTEVEKTRCQPKA